MTRKNFLKRALTSIPALLLITFGKSLNSKTAFKIRHLRHATLIIEINNKKILVDPMLSPKDKLDPVQNCGNEIRFPMVELPVPVTELNQILSEVDAVLVTHTHRDHWDVEAQNLVAKNRLIFCQPVDLEKIKGLGFTNVQSIVTIFDWEGLSIYRTGGRHGTGDIGKKMGEVSGFVIKHKESSLYIAGDTVWCEEVENALAEHKPTITILNAGGARFLTGDPITMTPDDIVRVSRKAPKTKIIAVHMDTVNHCFVRRSDLQGALAQKGLASEIKIPNDGEIILL